MNADNRACKRRAPLPLRDRFRVLQNGATALALTVMCLFMATPAHTAEKKAAPAVVAAPAAKDPSEDMAAAMEARARPSDRDNIAVLMPLVGTWDYFESVWTDPKATPERAMGQVVNDMMLDRHYMSSKAEGNIAIGAQQVLFQSMEMIGFDNGKKSLSMVEADTASTGMMIGTGKFDEKAGIIRETGRFTNPLTGVEQAFRSELQLVDNENYKRTIFAVDKAGKETKLIEIDCKRR